MSACPFCNYAGPSTILYDAGDVIVIRPLGPVSAGHVLVVPKEHVATAGENPKLTGRVFEVAAEIIAAFDLDANLIQSNGPCATQTVDHLHVHLVPRSHGDGLDCPWGDLLLPHHRTMIGG